jgi:hypothetical protein
VYLLIVDVVRNTGFPGSLVEILFRIGDSSWRLGISLLCIPLHNDSQGTGKGRFRDFGRLPFLERRGRDDVFGFWKWLGEWRGGRLEWASEGAREVKCEDIFQG